MDDERGGKPSASGMPLLVACPGSWLAGQNCFKPVQTAIEAAEEGDLVHLALQSGDDEWLSLNLKQITAKLKEAEDKILADWRGGLQGEGDPEVFHEERLYLRNARLEVLVSARLDFFALAGTQALIIDTKTGFLDLGPAAQDWQLRTQVLCLKDTYPEVTRITAGLLQHRFSTKWDPTLYTEKEIEWACTDLETYLRRASDPNSPRHPGHHCRYCRAHAECIEGQCYAALPIARVNLGGGMWDLRGEPLKGEARKREAWRLTGALRPEDLLFIHQRKTLATALFDAATARLKSLPAEVLAVLGQKLVPNTPIRSISQIQECYRLLKERGWVSDEEFRELCEVGVGNLEELVVPRIQQEHLEVEGKKLTVEDAKDRLDVVLRPAITLVPKAASLRAIKGK